MSDPRWQGCTIPPKGWWCSREPGHEGPCAARPDLDAPDNQEALAGEGVEAYVFATCVECTSPAACASRRFCGVGTHRVALQEEWRCVDCKRVFRCAEEPVRCPIGGCQGRTFAPVARTLPSNEALGDDRNGVEGLVERLREESLQLQKHAWSRMDGGQDCSISANLADEAADMIERLSTMTTRPAGVEEVGRG